jgi:hypothetical protein
VVIDAMLRMMIYVVRASKESAGESDTISTPIKPLKSGPRETSRGLRRPEPRGLMRS